MALKDFIKTSGLAALGLASSAVATLAVELEQPAPINLPPFPDLSAYIVPAMQLLVGYNPAEPSSVLPLRFLIWTLLVTLFALLVLRIDFLKENKGAAGLVAFVLAIFAMRYVPSAPILYLATSVGTAISLAITYAVPITVIAMSWKLSGNDPPWNWRWRGIGFILAGVISVVVLPTFYSIGGVSAGTETFFGTVWLGIPLIAIGLALIFRRTRARVLGKLSENLSVEALHDLGGAFRDIQSELGDTESATTYVRKAVSLAKKIPATGTWAPASGVLATARLAYSTLRIVFAKWKMARRFRGDLMARIGHELNVFKSVPTTGMAVTYRHVYGQVDSELQEIEQLAGQQATDEQAVFADLTAAYENLGVAINQGGWTAGVRTTVITALEKAANFLGKEIALQERIKTLLRKVDHEIASVAHT